MVIKKKEGVLGEGEIKPFTKEEMEAWKWPIRIFLILAISMFIGWSVYTTPGLMNSIFAKTATDVSSTGPSGGAGNPPISGAATPTKDELAKKDPGCDIWNEAVTVCLKRKTTPTPTPTPGQEKTTAYVPKYNPNGPDNPTGTEVQEVALNNLPEKLLIARGGVVYMRDLKVKNNYLYGYLGSIIDIDDEDVRIVFLDKNGNPTADHLVNSLSFGRYNEQTKQNEFAEHGKLSGSGIRNLKKGVELPFRVTIPKGAVFIQTARL